MLLIGMLLIGMLPIGVLPIGMLLIGMLPIGMLLIGVLLIGVLPIGVLPIGMLPISILLIITATFREPLATGCKFALEIRVLVFNYRRYTDDYFHCLFQRYGCQAVGGGAASRDHRELLQPCFERRVLCGNQYKSGNQYSAWG
jgi:hypothetical protein